MGTAAMHACHALPAHVPVRFALCRMAEIIANAQSDCLGDDSSHKDADQLRVAAPIAHISTAGYMRSLYDAQYECDVIFDLVLSV